MYSAKTKSSPRSTPNSLVEDDIIVYHPYLQLIIAPERRRQR
jgi:hypothetical protein